MNNIIVFLFTGSMVKSTRDVIHSTAAVPGRDSSLRHQTEKMVIYSSSNTFNHIYFIFGFEFQCK